MSLQHTFWRCEGHTSSEGTGVSTSFLSARGDRQFPELLWNSAPHRTGFPCFLCESVSWAKSCPSLLFATPHGGQAYWRTQGTFKEEQCYIHSDLQNFFLCPLRAQHLTTGLGFPMVWHQESGRMHCVSPWSGRTDIGHQAVTKSLFAFC